jgi:hypothetical protein
LKLEELKAYFPAHADKIKCKFHGSGSRRPRERDRRRWLPKPGAQLINAWNQFFPSASSSPNKFKFAIQFRTEENADGFYS